MTDDFPLQADHLAQLRRQLAVLVGRIEVSCAEAGDPDVRRGLEVTCAYAHALLDKVTLAEQAIAARGQPVPALARFREHLRSAQARFDASCPPGRGERARGAPDVAAS
jgi:hypothetical protein